MRRVCLILSAACVGSAACISPQRAARDADATAYDIVAEKQQAALGETQSFSIDRPEDELRRRLLLDQQLPAAGPASYGRAFLAPVPKQPDGVSLDLPLPDGADVVPRLEIDVDGTRTPTLATDIALVQIGSDLGRGAEPAAYDADAVPPELLLGPAAVVEPEPLVLRLIDALQVGARNSREYQQQKEQVYLAALALDLERDQFEFRFAATVDADVTTELEGDDTAGVVLSPGIGVSKLWKTGALVTTRIGLDLSRLLTGDEDQSYGLFADATITIPLLRGAGVEVVTEPLQQAERDAIYAIWLFERFKAEFAVEVADRYFTVLQALDTIANSEATIAGTGSNGTYFPAAVDFDTVMIGTWTWTANAGGLRWYLEAVVPRLPPDFRVAVAGSVPDELRAAHSRVNFLGRVDDAGAFLDQGHVVPLVSRGGTGVQLKTIEAFQNGRAAVATSSSLRGIAEPPANCRVADDPGGFAAALIDFVHRARAGETIDGDDRSFYETQRRALQASLANGVARAVGRERDEA